MQGKARYTCVSTTSYKEPVSCGSPASVSGVRCTRGQWNHGVLLLCAGDLNHSGDPGTLAVKAGPSNAGSSSPVCCVQWSGSLLTSDLLLRFAETPLQNGRMPELLELLLLVLLRADGEGETS